MNLCKQPRKGLNRRMNVEYGEEDEDDVCKKCGGMTMHSQTESYDKDGLIHFKTRCTKCMGIEKGSFDWHLGCVNWPHCKSEGCGGNY